MKKILLAAFCLTAVCDVFAAAVSPDLALSVAGAWLRENPDASSGDEVTGEAPRAEVSLTGTVLWYEVATVNGGCVITSPDTSLEPVVSYVGHWKGPLDGNNPLRILLEADLTDRLAAIGVLPQAKPRLMKTAVPSSATVADPLAESVAASESRWSKLSGTKSGKRLLGASGGTDGPKFVMSFIGEWKENRLTHWNQNNWNSFNYSAWDVCYDKYVPNNYPCGCVATAGATLLQYFNLTKAPSVTRKCSVDGNERSLTTKGGTYDWSSLPVVWKNGQTLTDAQIDLLGRACYDVGVCINMNYAEDGSSASIYTLAKSLKEDFGLSSATYRSVSASDFKTQIYAQTRAGAPVVLSIRRTGGGHAVLAVGYGEDAAGTAYTRVFMGWGGQSDAWYALPTIDNYTSVDAIVNELGADAEVVAICGKVRTSSGDPIPFAVIDCDGEKTFRADANGYWAGRVAPAKHVFTCRGEERSLSVSGSVTDVDFTVSNDPIAQPYTDAEEARAEALREGKPIFLLHGATWCQYCSKLKGFIDQMGTDFTDSFVYLWDDHDIDRYGLGAAGASLPDWSIHDPRTFDITKTLTSYAGRLYRCQGCPTTYDIFSGFVSTGLKAWAKVDAAPTSVDLGSSDAISSFTELYAEAVFADGRTVAVADGVEWKIVCGDAALLVDGALNPLAGKTGGVLLMGEAWLWGEKHTFFHRVSVLNGVSVTGIGISGPDALDLYDVASGSYKAIAQFSDGSSGTMPATWSVTESVGSSAMISESGVLSFSSYDFTGTETVTLTVKCSGFTARKTVTVTDPGGIVQCGGYFDKNVVWPGSTLTYRPTFVQWRRHGATEDPTTSTAGLVYEWIVVSDGYVKASGTGTTVTLPSPLPNYSSSFYVVLRVYPESMRYFDSDYGYVYVVPTVRASQPSFVDVKFDTNGNGTLPSMKCVAGGTYMRLPTLPKKGYSSSWRDVNGNSVSTSGTVPSSGITLYHSFSPNYYKIHYDANGGDGSMSDQWAYYDQRANLRANTFKKMGAVFKGWSLTPNGPVEYADKAAVLNWSDVYATFTLYAVWEDVAVSEFSFTEAEAILSATSLEASFLFGDGSVWAAEDVTWSIASGNAATISADGVLKPVSGRTGFVTVAASMTYRGKVYRAEKTVRVVTASQIRSLWIEGETTWIPRTTYETRRYQLVGLVDGDELLLSADSWTMLDLSNYYEVMADGTINCLYGGSVGTGTLNATLGSLSASLPIDFYATPRASWQPKPASVVLYPGAEVRLDDVFTITLADGTLRETCGYDGLLAYSLYFTDSTLDTDVSLFGSASKPSIVNGNILKVPENATCLTSDGFVYMRTAAEPMGSSQYYYMSGSIKFRWCASKPTSVGVTFDPAGGTLEGGSDAVVRTYAANTAYGTLPSPVRTGYSFSGWYTATSGGSKVEESTSVGSSDRRLYARWSSTTCYVYFRVNGGTGSNKTQSFTASDLANGKLQANAYKRAGYVFDGWSTSTSVSPTAKRYPDQAPLSSLALNESSYVYLYAVWRPVTGTTVPVVGTDVTVPKAWLDAHSAIVNLAGGDYAKAATMTAANGRSVWECYVAGLDPEDPNDDLALDIQMVDGKLVIDYNRKSRRLYVEEGRSSLSSGEWHSRREGDSFFRVRVMLP